MAQVELVDGNQILHGQGIFLNIQDAGATEIDNAVTVKATDYLADTVILRAGTVVHQVAQLDIIIGTPIKRIDHRQPIQSI